MGYIGNQPAETPVVEILETDFKIGEDDQTKIDFEDANKINFYANNAKEVELAENSLSPGSSNGTALGTTSLMWSDLFLASGGVMNFNDGNVTITHSANTLTVVGATVAFTASTAVTVSNDLKLASDSAVLGFGADNDTTLTHTDGTGLTLNSTNKLTFGDAASFIQQSGDGVLRIDGEATVDINASTAVTISNDLKLDSDSAVLSFGADSEASITHADDAGLTFNSDLTIADDKSITLGDEGQVIFSDVAPSTDHSATGIVIKGTLASGVTAGMVVYLKADGEYDHADKDAESTMPAVGVALEAAGSDKKILIYGVYVDASLSLTRGEELYVSDDGAVTHTVPGSGDFLQRVGVALTTTSVLFMPSLDVIEHA